MQERRPASRYASPQQVNVELREAEGLYRRLGVPFMDTTHTSVEEIAARVLHDKGLRRRERDAAGDADDEPSPSA